MDLKAEGQRQDVEPHLGFKGSVYRSIPVVERALYICRKSQILYDVTIQPSQSKLSACML
jgi:hypothetical protein